MFVTRPVDFIDAHHAALIEADAEPELYSYDTHFDHVPGIRRLEP